MNYAAFVDAVAAESGLSPRQVRGVLSAAGAVVARAIAAGDSVRIPALGSFAARRRGARTVRSVHDMRKVMVGERWAARVTPAKALRDAAASLGSQAWRSEDHQAAWRLAETLVADLELYHAARAPRLGTDLAPARVHDACETAFGPLWTRVTTAWSQQVGPQVRAEHDYLAAAAQRRWAA